MTMERERSQGTVRWALATGQPLTECHGLPCFQERSLKLLSLPSGEGGFGQSPITLNPFVKYQGLKLCSDVQNSGYYTNQFVLDKGYSLLNRDLKFFKQIKTTFFYKFAFPLSIALYVNF